MVRNLAEPRSIFAEPLGSAEPRLKNTALTLPRLGLKFEGTSVEGKLNNFEGIDLVGFSLLETKNIK
jgi:hypothetical protein